MLHFYRNFLIVVTLLLCYLPSFIWCGCSISGSSSSGNPDHDGNNQNEYHRGFKSSSLFGIVPRGGASENAASWTFDMPCTRMPWTPITSTSLNLVTHIENADEIDTSEYDLIIIGVTAAKSDGNDDGPTDQQKRKNKKKKTDKTAAPTAKARIQLDPHSIVDYLNMSHNGIVDTILSDEDGFQKGKVKHNSMTNVIRISIPTSASTNPNTNDDDSSFVDAEAAKLLKFVLLGFDTTPAPNKNSNNNENDEDIRAKGRQIGSTLASLVEKEIKKKKRSNSARKALVIMPFSTRLSNQRCNSVQDTKEKVRHRMVEDSSFIEEMSCSFYTDLYKDKRFKGTAMMNDNNGEDYNKDADDSSLSPSTYVDLVWEKSNPPLQNNLPLSVAEGESNLLEDKHDTSGTSNENDQDDKECRIVRLLSYDEINQALDRGRQIALGVYMAKDIVNSPHNILNSVSLAETAQRICSETSSTGGVLSCQILDTKECEKRGMGSYLAVARGSETVPKFIHITYRPKRNTYNRKSDLRKLGVIGKGLLFDTGGYNIKTAMMELMKFDCGGAAAVLGAARAIGALGPKGVEVHFVVAACENMINERAVVPGDVITASNGKTIEVINTDAEGRLTMADALVYIDNEIGCEEIIELSTLTGACMVSLGSAMAGLWTNHDDLATNLQLAASSTGDKVWRMPMVKEYKEQIKSKIADLRNLGTVRYGGAIHAALFLQEFVDNDKPFAHIDMAGPVWSTKVGATGYGAKLVTEWVWNQSN